MVVRNINLGTPYEEFIDLVIRKELAGNRTEVIRQALACYKRELEAEELILVGRGVDSIMARIKSGEMKTFTQDEIEREFDME